MIFTSSTDIPKSSRMFMGEIDPVDKNFFTLRHDQKVYVECYNGELVSGTIRRLKDDVVLPEKMKPCYLVVKDDGNILTNGDLRNRTVGIGIHNPKLFNIDFPNHEIVFDDMDSYHKHKICKLQEYAKKLRFKSLIEMKDYIELMSEEYPEQFI